MAGFGCLGTNSKSRVKLSIPNACGVWYWALLFPGQSLDQHVPLHIRSGNQHSLYGESNGVARSPNSRPDRLKLCNFHHASSIDFQQKNRSTSPPVCLSSLLGCENFECEYEGVHREEISQMSLGERGFVMAFVQLEFAHLEGLGLGSSGLRCCTSPCLAPLAA